MASVLNSPELSDIVNQAFNTSTSGTTAITDPKTNTPATVESSDCGKASEPPTCPQSSPQKTVPIEDILPELKRGGYKRKNQATSETYSSK